jgi:hypothetical protein
MGRLRIEATLIKYIDYSTGYAIKTKQTHPSWSNQDGWTNDKMQNADPNPIAIPPYQRKLVWKGDDIEKLFAGEGKLLGNITFANEDIPNSSKTQLTLVDGLQRFSAITSIMRSLYNHVLSTHASYPLLADSHFQKIRDTLSPAHAIIWEHNHNMLLNSTRTGIRSSYEELASVVDEYIVGELEKIKKDPSKLEFAQQVHKTLFDKMVVVDVYLDFETSAEIIETFKDVNSTGVTLSNTDILRATIILQADDLRWRDEDITEGENRFTLTLQPESGVPNINKEYRKWFGLRLWEAHNNNDTNVFPDWANLSTKSLDTLFDYIENCEEATKKMITNSVYAYPYVTEIIKCGTLPFIAFIWFYYQNYYLQHLQEIQSISDKIKEEYTLESMSENESSEQSTEQIESHVNETLEKLKKIDELIDANAEKLNATNISDSRKRKLQEEKDKLEELRNAYPDYYRDLPDFLGGTLDTTQNAWLFLRAAYRRQMNGNIGSTAPIVDRLMNRDITTMAGLANEFNPTEDAGPLNKNPNENWLRSRLLAKGGTTQAKFYFNACLLPERIDGGTKFAPLIYGGKVGQWNIDHLIPRSKVLAGEGNNEGKKIVNLAPLDNAHNSMAKNIGCAEKITATGYYSQIMDAHDYCKWLVEEHYVNHQYDNRQGGVVTGEIIQGAHPLDNQASLVHNHLLGIGDERIDKLISLLTPKL